MHQSLKLSQKALLMVAALLIAELCLLVGLTSLLGQAQYHRMRAEHSKKLFDEADAIYKLFYESGISLVRLGISQNNESLKVFDDSIVEIPRRVQRMRDLSEGNEKQLKAINTIDNTLQTKGFPFLKDIRNAIVENKGSPASFLMLKKKRKHLQALMEELGAELTVVSAPEREVQEQSPKVIQAATDRATIIIYCLFAFNIVVAFGIFYVFMGGIVKRLSVISDNSDRMARGETLSKPMPGNDEISQLDSSFHTMADALKEALRKERTILENAADIIITIDAHNQISSVNPACHQTLGYQPEELLGMRIGSLLEEETAATTIDALASLKGSEKTLTFDNRLRRQNGTMCDMRWSANWSESERSFFCVIHDVSQQKELERLKKEVIRMVSHDLRSPLSSVSSLLELLSYEMYGKLNEVGERRVNATRLEVDRLIRMINDLLDFEKMEAGKLELHCINTKSETIFEKSIEAIRGLAEKKNIKIETKKSDVNVHCDEDRIIQVVVNLVSNAIKFSDKDGKLILSAEQLDGTGKLNVIDFGRGIPEEKIGTIFDRFSQVEAADAKQESGTGLGLAICKSIIDQHGGTIGVESAPGEGSTFWFTLPSAVTDAAKVADASNTTETADTSEAADKLIST